MCYLSTLRRAHINNFYTASEFGEGGIKREADLLHFDYSAWRRHDPLGIVEYLGEVPCKGEPFRIPTEVHNADALTRELA